LHFYLKIGKNVKKEVIMKSLWIETTSNEIKLNSLEKDEETEVCIIGAGLFGLTTAYYLTMQGKKVIVLDKGDISEKRNSRNRVRFYQYRQKDGGYFVVRRE
jgi:monoamine oxidase